MMILHLKKELRLLLFLIIITILSCESEHVHYNSEIKITEKVNILSLDSLPFLKPSVYNFNIQHSKTTTFGKSDKTLSPDIVLNTNEILELVRENGEKTYSIKMYRSIDANESIYFENLHIVPTKKGYKSFILRWIPSDPTAIFAVHTFNGTVKLFDINYNLKKQVTIVNGKVTNNITSKSAAEAPQEKNCYEISDCYCKGNNIGVHDCTLGLTVPVDCGGGSSENPGSVNPQDPTYPPGNPSDDPPVAGGGSSYVVPNYSLKEQQFVQSLGNIQSSYFHQLHGLATLKVFNYLKVRNYDSEVTAPAKNGLLRVDLNWLKNQTQSAQIATMDFITTNYFSLNSINIVNSLKDAIINYPNLKFDIVASFKSPMNIDRSAITNDTPEGQKFNEIYNALTQSPEFKNLFVSMFGDLFSGNYRHNVKFELADAVYDSDNPTKEINANTTYDPNLPYILIKINKKILNNSSMKQTKIENAKTVLHEFIHAYLYTIANNPIVGPTDIASLLNKKYPVGNEQHDLCTII